MTGTNEVPGGDTSRVFVGRKPELAELRAALDRATSGRGGVVLVAGEPGIGKSELADRLAGEATARGAGVLWGRSWEGEGAPPYWPWAQIIRDYAREAGREFRERSALRVAAQNPRTVLWRSALATRYSISGRLVEHSVLALHLENAIRTGTFCSYRPDRSTDWDL
jgi:predicted ATPase